jgi:hypothetical protein
MAFILSVYAVILFFSFIHTQEQEGYSCFSTSKVSPVLLPQDYYHQTGNDWHFEIEGLLSIALELAF